MGLLPSQDTELALSAVCQVKLQEGVCLQTRKQALAARGITLTLNFPASRPVGRKWCRLSHPVCGHLLQRLN